VPPTSPRQVGGQDLLLGSQCPVATGQGEEGTVGPGKVVVVSEALFSLMQDGLVGGPGSSSSSWEMDGLGVEGRQQRGVQPV